MIVSVRRLAESCGASLSQRSMPAFSGEAARLHVHSSFRAWVLLLLVSLLVAVSPARAKSAMQEYVEAMQPGWNLGNTLDATPTETSWGNPVTSQELIRQVRAQGFKSIRIPVTWDKYLGPAPTYTIDPVWLNHVEQIVNWSLDEGLYVMLNMHHDSYWLRKRPANYLARYTAVWAQLAQRFRDHSPKLMLESINEPEFDDVDDATEMALLREMNTVFFNTVRSTGGGNSTRPLVLPSVATNAGQPFLDSLKATMQALNDPNLIATTHYYGFWPFSVNITGVTKMNSQVIEDITGSLQRCHDTFVAAGIPMVIGEIGILSYNPYMEVVERGEMLKFFELYTAEAKAKGITWQIWDSGNQFDRYRYVWRDPELFGYFIDGVTGRSSTAETDLVFVRSGHPTDIAIPLNLNGNAFVSLTNGDTPLVRGSDYEIEGSLLTLKAKALAPYSSGAYGARAVFAANFSAGRSWNFRVRHQASAVLGEASGNKTDGMVIPVTFNGDLLATLEARYVGKGSPYPGDATWTAFKQYDINFAPDYANGTVVIKPAFFAPTTNEAVELTFHMWSGRKLSYRLGFLPSGGIITNPELLRIYEEGLASGWTDSGSWAAHDLGATSEAHSGTKAISVSAGAYGGLLLTNAGQPVDTSSFRTLVFWVHGGTQGGQNFGVRIERNGDGSSPGVSIPTPPAGTWRKVEIPLSSLGVLGSSNITRVIFQNWTNGNAAPLYIDDVYLTTGYASDLVFVQGTPAPVVTSPVFVTGVQGKGFSYEAEAVNAPVTLTPSGLPAWLSYDSTTHVIAGTPTEAGTYHFTLTAGNTSGTFSEDIIVRIFPASIGVLIQGVADNQSGRIQVPYDGTAHPVTITTQPEGVPMIVTYDGGLTPPTLPGTYQVSVRPQDDRLAGSAEATIVITSANPGRLINLSVRAVSGRDSDILVMGFVSKGGSRDASLLVRGIGPTLVNYGISEGLLADPGLTLFSRTNKLSFNEDWSNSLTEQFQKTGAFELPANSKDAALAVDLPAGEYTAQVGGQDGAAGIALGEVFDLNTTYTPETPALVNASARCRVGGGHEVLVPGFVIGGDTPLRVLIRAVGPTLSEYGVSGLLADPKITLYRGLQEIGGNDNWDGSLAATFAKVGAFSLPTGSKDAALVVELPPGTYSAHVKGADGQPGVALVELYVLPGL